MFVGVGFGVDSGVTLGVGFGGDSGVGVHVGERVRFFLRLVNFCFQIFSINSMGKGFVICVVCSLLTRSTQKN